MLFYEEVSWAIFRKVTNWVGLEGNLDDLPFTTDTICCFHSELCPTFGTAIYFYDSLHSALLRSTVQIKKQRDGV